MNNIDLNNIFSQYIQATFSQIMLSDRQKKREIETEKESALLLVHRPHTSKSHSWLGQTEPGTQISTKCSMLVQVANYSNMSLVAPKACIGRKLECIAEVGLEL